MHCSLSDDYLKNAGSPSELARLQEDALQDICIVFNVPISYGVPDEALTAARYSADPAHQDYCFIYDVGSKGGFFLNPPQRAFILNHKNWCYNKRYTISPSGRGSYVYKPAVILLHENGDSNNSWCKKTLIHETLHSVSIYSRIWDRFNGVTRLHYGLIEGITECLAGYILLKRHPDCYDVWKRSNDGRCSISYRPNVKLWCSLCQCVGIQDLAGFYLSQKENPTEAWDQFVQSIHAKNFYKFNYKLDFNKSFKESDFRQACINSIPDFKEIYESLTKSLDFTRI